MSDMPGQVDGMTDRVMIGQPGRQHSHHLAKGLAEADLLAAYCSGQFNEKQLNAVPEIFRRLLPAALVRNAVPFLGMEVSSTRPMGTIVNHLARKVPRQDVNLWGELAGFSLYDHQFSRLVAERKPGVVIGYEMACLRSFTIAKQLGAVCILDAAACHHSLQDLRMPDVRAKGSRAGRLIRKRKDAELALANLLICPSQLSAQSYIGAGFAPEKIVVNSLGVSSTIFSGAAVQAREGVINFVFVANARIVKGTDYVEAAVVELQKAGTPATIQIVGGARVDARSGGSVQVMHHGHVSHHALAKIFAGADCLLLPSRLESFGMVVLESMASGVPVVVSDWVGAASLITQGVDGWRFGETLDGFLGRVRWCADNVASLRAMRAACLETAHHNSWKAYEARAVAVVEAVTRDR